MNLWADSVITTSRSMFAFLINLIISRDLYDAIPPDIIKSILKLKLSKLWFGKKSSVLTLFCELSDSIAFSLFLGILLSFFQFETVDGFIFSLSATNPVPPSKKMSCEISFIKLITKKIKDYIKNIEDDISKVDRKQNRIIRNNPKKLEMNVGFFYKLYQKNEVKKKDKKPLSLTR